MYLCFVLYLPVMTSRNKKKHEKKLMEICFTYLMDDKYSY